MDYFVKKNFTLNKLFQKFMWIDIDFKKRKCLTQYKDYINYLYCGQEYARIL